MSAHPTECRCVDCIQQLQHDSDRAQAQTLGLLDLLGSQRRDLRRLQADVNTMIDRLCDRLGSVIGTEPQQPPKAARGFARLSPDQRKKVAAQGGKTAQARGLGHKFTREDNVRGGKKAGEHWRNDRDHLSEIGRKGGRAGLGKPKKTAETQDDQAPEKR